MGRAPCCEKAEVKKGPWSIQEDQILMNYIALHGHSNWRALPKQAGLKRCGKSCRLRWFNYLKPDIKRGNFTKQEEDAIINLHQMLGNKWSAIAARLPGRTDNEIKNVWHTHLKKRLINKDEDDNNHENKQQQQQPAPAATSSSSLSDGGRDQANSSSSSSSSTKSNVDDDDDNDTTIQTTTTSYNYDDDTTFSEIDHNFLSQVLFSDDDHIHSDVDLISSTTTTTGDDHHPPFACSLSSSPAALLQDHDQYCSSSPDHHHTDDDDHFWFNLYTTAAADADYSIHTLPDISFDSLTDPPAPNYLH